MKTAAPSILHSYSTSFISIRDQYQCRPGLKLLKQGTRRIHGLCCAAAKQSSRNKNRARTQRESTLNPQKRPTPTKKQVRTAEHTEDNTSHVHHIPLPSPPAGFVVDDSGRVLLMAPPEKRTTVIVDPANQRTLECMVRRIFSSSQGEKCWLLCPLDMPVQILKMEENDGVQMLDDKEIEEVIPAAAYALAKRHMHLILSGFCFTARGGFCYSEEDIIELDSGYDQSLGGTFDEGVEVANFQVEDSEYLVYSPIDPLFFVAVKDENGELQMAEDDLLDDDLVLDAIDEENEFQALVEQEPALIRALKEE